MSDLPDGWYDELFVSWRGRRHRAFGRTVDLLLDYDPKRLLDDQLCNAALLHGATCRALKGHEHPHVPFSGELIATSGVYCRQVVPHEDPDTILGAAWGAAS